VQLPPVTWYDYWTGAKLPPLPKLTSRDMEQPGAREEMERLMKPFHVTPALDALPVYIREGAILPLAPLTQSTNETPKGPLTLRVYLPQPGQGAEQPCRGSVYLDDGTTLDYQKGASLREEFSCSVSGDTVSVKAAPRDGSYPAWWQSLRAEVHGGSATKATASEGATAAYDAAHQAMVATIADSGKGAELTLRYSR
jgi:alpha-glucosidase